MLSAEENELLCRVGAGTPMGRMLRRYWIPALLSEELEPDGPPRRVRLLGENLVAFRDSDGRIGLLDENCPHRGASLVLARNEACGLRCLYHGWKIDVTGAVLEAPPEPEELRFAERVRATAFPCYEAGGMVWAYLGPPGTEPPRLNFEWTTIPDSRRWLLKARVESNWVQGVEGVLDSAHTNFLHRNIVALKAELTETAFADNGRIDRPSVDGAPRLYAQDTAYGFRYAAIRKPVADPETMQYVRVSLFVAPFYVFFPFAGGFLPNMQILVPIDDEHSMFYFIKSSNDKPFDDDARHLHAHRAGLVQGVDMDADYRKRRSPENLWLQDRGAMQRGESFTGVHGVSMEDMMVQESMGPIYDRRKEHLGASDIAVIRMRRLMLDAVRRFDQRGEPPLGLAEPVPYDRLRAEERLIATSIPWQTVGANAGEAVTAT